MKKLPKNNATAESTVTPSALEGLYDSVAGALFKSNLVDRVPDIFSNAEKTSSITPCQYFPKIIVDGVDVAKMLTDIAVVTGALRDSTSVTNLDVVQHWSAERLAYFIVNDSKKIISGSGDAVAELTEWLKSKAK